jgi:hypothetical protein
MTPSSMSDACARSGEQSSQESSVADGELGQCHPGLQQAAALDLSD